MFTLTGGNNKQFCHRSFSSFRGGKKPRSASLSHKFNTQGTENIFRENYNLHVHAYIHCQDFFFCLTLSLSSPRARLLVVGMLRFMSDIYQPRSFSSLYSVLVSISALYGPFNCTSFHTFSRQLSIFSLYSSGHISALLVLSTTYRYMKVSISPDIIRSG